MQLGRLKEMCQKIQTMPGSHRDPRLEANELLQHLDDFLSASDLLEKPDDSDVKFDTFISYLSNKGFHHAKIYLEKIPKYNLLRRITDSWQHGFNQETFLNLVDILEIPWERYLVLGQSVYDIDELKQNIKQDHYYRHPESGGFFTRHDIAHMRRFGLRDYADKLEHLYDEQYNLPQTIVRALHEMLSTYYVYGSKPDGRFQFDEAGLRHCEAAKAEFMAKVMDHPPSHQAQFFNCMVRCHYADSRLPDVTVEQLFRPDQRNYQGCIIVEQIRLWMLLTSRYPNRFYFPRALHDRNEFRLGAYVLPPGVKIGETPEEQPVREMPDAGILPAKRAKRASGHESMTGVAQYSGETGDLRLFQPASASAASAGAGAARVASSP